MKLSELININNLRRKVMDKDVRLDLDVPEKEEPKKKKSAKKELLNCPMCGGSGVVNEEKTCPECRGKGRK